MAISIASFSSAEPDPNPSRKKLQFTDRYVAKEQPVNGLPPRGFVTTEFLHLMPDGHEYTVDIPVTGTDACREIPYLHPVFEFERLADGHTTQDRLHTLQYEMKREVRRMRSEPDTNVSTSKALAILRQDLLDLHELGYTIDELQRLVRGSLRISITTEELQMALFANTSGP